MKKPIIILALFAALSLVFGCSPDGIVDPDGPALADKTNPVAMPEFHTMFWPPPYYPPSVMAIDFNSGAGSPVTSLMVDPSPPGWPGAYPGFATPYGIAFDVDGTPYTLHNWFAGVQEYSFSQLVRLDLATGAATPIGPVHEINFAGPEFDEWGNLWATGFTAGPPEGGPIYVWGNSNLYRIDKNTGEKTLIGDTGHTEWMDLDFDHQGRLWATFGNDLYTLDTQTGESTFVTHVDGVEDNRIPGVCDEDWEYMEIMGIAFDHKGVLWATAMKGFSLCGEGGLAAPVMTIDIEAGRAHLVGSTILDGQSHGGDIPPRKVRICHVTRDGGYVPIQVNLASLSAHLEHGDHMTTSPMLGCHQTAQLGQQTGNP